MKYQYLILLITLVFISCNSSNGTNANKNYPKGLKCEYTSKDDIYKIDMSKAIDIKLEDIVDFEMGVRIIPLEVTKDNIFGEVTKMLVFKDTYYMVDMNLANNIVAFDRQGNYLFKIDNQGKAPNQYLKIWDAQINQNIDNLEIWDLPQQKLLRYDLTGNFISSKRIDLPVMSFFPIINKEWYIYHLDGRSHMGQNLPLLLYSDISGKNIINRGASEYGIVDTWFDKNEFDIYNNDIYFHRPMSDTIYWIGPVNGQICPVYIIDFGKDRMPLLAKKESDMLKMADYIKKSEASFTLGNLLVGRNYLHFMWTSERTLTEYHHLVDRFNYQSYQISEKNLKIFDLPIKKFLSVDKNEFIGYNFLGDFDKSKLNDLKTNQSRDSLLRLDIENILKLEDPNTPLLFKFNLKSSE